jgi:hypothetical protein
MGWKKQAEQNKLLWWRTQELTQRIDGIVAAQQKVYVDSLNDFSKFRKEMLGIVAEWAEVVNLKEEMDSLKDYLAMAEEEYVESLEYHVSTKAAYAESCDLYYEKKIALDKSLEGIK